MADIFISYSQQDRDFANQLYRELQRFKVRGFMDAMDVSAGADISRQLKETIENTDALLVILSQSASQSSWVMAEIGLAQTLGKTVLPVLAPGQNYEDSVPPQLMDRVVIDASSLAIDQVAARVVAAITDTSVETALQEVQSRAHRRQRFLVTVSLALAVLSLVSLISAFLVFKQRKVAIYQMQLAEQSRLEAEKRRERIDMLTGGDASMALSPDGQSLATGSRDGSIRIWNIATGQTIALFKGHLNRISSLAYSPDAQLLASASWDGTVGIWDTSKGKQVLKLRGHTDSVISVQFTPDGRTFFSRSLDGTIRQWDVKSGKIISVLNVPE